MSTPYRTSRISRSRRVKHLALASALITISTNCTNSIPHHGRLPFRWMEKPPKSESIRAQPMRVTLRHNKPGTPATRQEIERIQAGDVIAFTMSHREAWRNLRKGRIQKIPYELFRYGHLALVVPDPNGTQELQLLQVAMKQSVNATDGLDYLDGKTWEVHRPPSGSLDPDRLAEFTRQVTENASDPDRAYDYVGISGWNNSPWQPDKKSDIGDRYSCATLVVAALHYAGYELNAVHRGGRLDLVTPGQVIDSGGIIKAR